ncbi:MAG TPA: hypothetical protein DEB39_09725 [Planctomycetaceae bacterium]|nr:hypothetical protein [Planctomycetaceae bacterium]
MQAIDLPLDSIRTDAKTQMRIAMCDKTVNEYAEDLAPLPPITVFQIDDTYVLADGFHRLAAYKKRGRDTIPCVVMQGTLDDAREFACGANSTHGLRRSDEDKRNAVESFFQIPGRENLTNSEAGRRLNLSTPYVKKVREELGVKASPASHHGAGSPKRRLNDLILPVKPGTADGSGLNRLIPTSKPSGRTVTVTLPLDNEHEFAVVLFEHVDDLKYLKSCSKYIGNLFEG